MVKPFVRFGYADRLLGVNNKRAIRLFVGALVQAETGKPCCLQYVFCSDAYLHQINVSFLQHDDFTDIITFDLSVDPEVCIEGEIYISIDRVAANAKELAVPFEQEMLRVIFHGALHLCGYKDKSKADVKRMRAKEDYYLSAFGVG